MGFASRLYLLEGVTLSKFHFSNGATETPCVCGGVWINKTMSSLLYLCEGVSRTRVCCQAGRGRPRLPARPATSHLYGKACRAQRGSRACLCVIVVR